MPQIDTPLLLDILLGLAIVLFVPFGVRRGVSKEAMVSASIFLGATLADRFAATWGNELSGLLNVSNDQATFAASVLVLFGITFLLGYGGGAALGPSRPGLSSRLVGGLLAAFNAGLLLSFLLRWITQILLQGAALDEGIVSSALVRHSDLLLVGATGALLLLTIVGWIANGARARRQPRESLEPHSGGIRPRQRPVRVAATPDAGKFEPEAEPAARSGRFASGIDATAPLSSSSPYQGAVPWSEDGGAPRVSNGHGAHRDSPSPLSSGAPRTPDDETIWAAWSVPSSEDASSRSGVTSQWPVAPSIGVTDDERCAVCRARVGPRDVFCPECGATL